MNLWVDGLEWVTTGEACARLDIAGEALRAWYRPAPGRGPRVRLLTDPDGRPVTHRRQLMVCWPDVVEAEHATRTRPRRPRTISR